MNRDLVEIVDGQEVVIREKWLVVGGHPDYQALPLIEQLEFWQKHFPDLDPSFAENFVGRSPSPRAKGLFAVPKVEEVASGLREALTKCMLPLLPGDFTNHVGGHLGEDNLRLVSRTRDWYTRMTEDTPGSYMVFPAQLGGGRQSRSFLSARADMSPDEVGLDPYIVTALLAMHPERLSEEGHMPLACPGANYAFANGQFGFGLCFERSSEGLRLDYQWLGPTRVVSGFATAFITE